MWSTELLTRHGYTLMIVYRNGETMGSFNFPDGDKDILTWQKLVESLNNLSQNS